MWASGVCEKLQPPQFTGAHVQLRCNVGREEIERTSPRKESGENRLCDLRLQGYPQWRSLR